MRKAYDCLVSCLIAAEDRFGNNVSESEVFWFFGDRKVYLNDEEFASDSHLKMEHIMEQGLMKLYNRNDLPTDCTLEEYIMSKTENGVVLLEMDSTLLKYRSIYSHNMGVLHYVCLTGYNSETNKAYIKDWFVPNDDNEPFEGWVDFSELKEAWNATGNLHFLMNEALFVGDRITNDIRQVVLVTIENYLNPEKAGESCWGIEAADNWIKRLSPEEDWDRALTDLRVKGFLTLKIYMWKFFTDNLKDCVAVDNYRRIIEEWDKLCMMIVYMKMRRKASALDEFKKVALELLDREKEILTEIINEIKKEKEK